MSDPIPIEAIDAAAVKLMELHRQRLIFRAMGAFSATADVLSRDVAEEWARQVLEAVALGCVPDWQTCGQCGQQRRELIW